MLVSPDGQTHLRQAKLQVRFFIQGDSEEYEGETIGFSPEQLFMSSSTDMQAGTEVSITVRVPVELSGSPFNEVIFSGKVLSASKLARGTFGYQIAIQRA